MTARLFSRRLLWRLAFSLIPRKRPAFPVGELTRLLSVRATVSIRILKISRGSEKRIFPNLMAHRFSYPQLSTEQLSGRDRDLLVLQPPRLKAPIRVGAVDTGTNRTAFHRRSSHSGTSDRICPSLRAGCHPDGCLRVTVRSLKGAGETRLPFLAQMAGQFGIFLGFSYIASVILGFGPLGIYAGVALNYVFMVLIVLWAYTQSDWADRAAEMIDARSTN